MISGLGKHSPHVARASVLGETRPQVAIHAKIKCLIKAVHLVIELTSPECRGLRNVVVVILPNEPVKRNLFSSSQNLAAGTDYLQISIHKIRIRVFTEIVQDEPHGASFQEVIG